MNTHHIPPQALCTEIFLEKYAKQGETTFAELRMRVARALAAVENDTDYWTKMFFEAMESGFVPAGRISSAAGTDIKATLINCFVQGIGDTMADVADDGKPGITTALKKAAETLRRGGGVGYNFSRLRPRGGYVSGTASRSSGPVSFMSMFDKMCETVESAGARRGAQMGMLNCDHPDIMEFIHAKDARGQLNNFNISIAVTDAFMNAVASADMFELVHKCTPHPAEIEKNGSYQRADGMWVYRTLPARDIWDAIMESTYDHAEPGIIYIDRANAENNLHYCELIEATNPCGEQMLPDYGCCCLGSIDLTQFVRNAFTPNATFDWDAYCKVIRIAVRMLDNVLDITYWPLPEQRDEAMAKRRIGLGYLGLGNALIMLNVGYSTMSGLQLAARITETMRDESYSASISLATEKGAFPLLNAEQYLKSGFAERLPDNIRMGILNHGIRNSHLMSIAPTGTISLAFADNASNGIEPSFTWAYTRRKRMDDGSTREYRVLDHAYRLYSLITNGAEGDIVDPAQLPPAFISALEMSAEDHMRMLEVVQPFVDSSISKTVNVPEDYPYEDFKDLYMQGWRAGLKGLATYRPNAVLGAVLVADAPKSAPVEENVEETAIPDVNPLTLNFPSRPAGDMDAVNRKMIYHTLEGEKKIYLSVSFMRVVGVVNGQDVSIERPIEFFVPAGQRDDSQQWVAATMRLLSQIARSGASVADALSDMREVIWDKGVVRYGTIERAPDTFSPRQHESEVAAIAYALQDILHRRGFLDSHYRERPLNELIAASSPIPFTIEFTELDSAVSPGGVKEFMDRWMREVGNTADDGAQGALRSMAMLANTMSEVQESIAGTKCSDCGKYAVIKVDGCKRCTACGHIGACS